MKVADRCLVMYKGRINADLDRDAMNEEHMMYYSTGSNKEAADIKEKQHA